METSTDLSLLINPRSIALVGASDREDSIGAHTLDNLVKHSSFKVQLYLVNPGKAEIRGQRCWPSVAALPEAPDVAVVVVPAAGVLGVIEDCAQSGVRFAVVLSSGFGEAGEEGEKAQLRMKEIAARSGLRLYGPNCPGLCNVNQRLGMTFSPAFPHDLVPGPIGLATQGGGLGRNVMQAMERGVGIGLWASTGNEVDLQVADFIHYMADAPDIRVIVTLFEGIKDGPRLMSALKRAAEQGKPVVALKIGRSEYGAQAAQSHTASLTGSSEVNSAVLRQFGVIEVDDIDELVDAAWLFARAMPGPKEGVAIYCASGGTAALLADILGTTDLQLPPLAPETTETLRANLPSYAAIGNPIDTTSVVVSDAQVVQKTMGAVGRDPNLGLVLVPNALDYGATTARMARNIIDVQKSVTIPIVPVWMSDRLGEGYQLLVKEGFAPPRSAGKAVKAVQRWVSYGRWKRGDPQLPAWNAQRIAQAHAASQQGGAARVSLTESAAKERLARAGIQVLPSQVAATAGDAARIAEAMGFPVVAKIASADITHKSDVGGVRVGLCSGGEVRQACEEILANVARHRPGAKIDGLLIEKMAPAGGFELVVGVTRDPVFGHVMTVGLGGIYVEILRDVVRRLLPLTPRETAAMVRELRSFPLLDGARGRARADVDALEALLLKVSDLVSGPAGDRLEELELNPVWVGAQGQGAMPLDAVLTERAGS